MPVFYGIVGGLIVSAYLVTLYVIYKEKKEKKRKAMEDKLNGDIMDNNRVSG